MYLNLVIYSVVRLQTVRCINNYHFIIKKRPLQSSLSFSNSNVDNHYYLSLTNFSR